MWLIFAFLLPVVDFFEQLCDYVQEFYHENILRAWVGAKPYIGVFKAETVEVHQYCEKSYLKSRCT